MFLFVKQLHGFNNPSLIFNGLFVIFQGPIERMQVIVYNDSNNDDDETRTYSLYIQWLCTTEITTNAKRED